MTDEFHETAIDAINEALIRLGEDLQIKTLSKNPTDEEAHTSVARKCAFIYEQCRRRVLNEHAWSFASVVENTTSVSRDNGVWIIPMPGNMTSIQACYTADGRKPEWYLTGKDIYSYEPISQIVYTRDIEDLEEWDQEVRSLLVARLAAELAKPITGRKADVDTYESVYLDLLARTKLWDTRQSNPTRKPWGNNYIADKMNGAGEDD